MSLLVESSMEMVVNNLVSETPILLNESCAIIIAEIRRLFKRSEERMDSLMKRIDESRAGADRESDVLSYEPLPMEVTMDDTQGMDSAIGAIGTIVPGEVGITKVAMDTDIGATTTGTSSMLPRPPMASIFTKELVPMTGLAATASLAVGAVPVDTNSDTPNNCLRKCLSPEVGIQTSKSAAEGMPTLLSSYVLPDICTLRLPVMRLKSPKHTILGACQCLKELSPCTVTLYNNGVVLHQHTGGHHGVLQTVFTRCQAHITIFFLGMASVSFLLPAPPKWALQQQWPPPLLFMVLSDILGLRPMLWPFFTMVDGEHTLRRFSWPWKPPWLHPEQTEFICVHFETENFLENTLFDSAAFTLMCKWLMCDFFQWSSWPFHCDNCKYLWCKQCVIWIQLIIPWLPCVLCYPSGVICNVKASLIKRASRTSLQDQLTVLNSNGEHQCLLSGHSIATKLHIVLGFANNISRVWCLSPVMPFLGNFWECISSLLVGYNSWPWFILVHEITASELYSLDRKPPCPPQAPQKFLFVSAKILQSLGCLMLSSVSTYPREESDFPWCLHMLVVASYHLFQKLFHFGGTAVLILQLSTMHAPASKCELLVPDRLLRDECPWCITTGTEFSKVQNSQCPGKCLLVQRKLPLLLCCDYGAFRFSSEVPISTVVPLHQTAQICAIQLLLQNRGYGRGSCPFLFLVHKQLFSVLFSKYSAQAYTLGEQFRSPNTATMLPCMLFIDECELISTMFELLVIHRAAELSISVELVPTSLIASDVHVLWFCFILLTYQVASVSCKVEN